METINVFSEKAAADFVLVEEAKNGSEMAFTSLMNRYRDPLYFMIFKMVNNSTDAEDITIETFGKAFSNINNYTPKFAFSTWLFKIASNNCIDFIRKKQMSPIQYDSVHDNMDGIAVTHRSNLPDPEESLINSQKTENLKDIVNQMRPRYRKLIQLRYYKDYTYEEISAELKIPVGTVKAELHRAKTELHNKLTKIGKG
jgi:RNA polymerase sigma-70 factor (ECF subfamily)